MANNKYHNHYHPDTVSIPGTTLKAKIEEMNLSLHQFAQIAALPLSTVEEIIEGRRPIAQDIAASLEAATLIPAHFWLARQQNYDLHCVQPNESSSSRSSSSWLSRLHLRPSFT